MKGLAISLALVTTLTAQSGRSGAPGSPCDRVCLEGFVTQYLDALMSRNPFGLPLAARVRFSENDQPLALGDGLWNTVTGPGSFQLYASDPTRGQVGFLGTLRENGVPVAFSLRLKIEGGRIADIETTVVREAGAPAGGGMSAAARLEQLKSPEAALVETVPPGRRQSRDALLAAANAHFDEIEHQQERTVYPRRFGVIDEERQLVFGSFIHQEAGDADRGTVPSFEDVTAVLRVANGRIGGSQQLSVTLPYGTPNPFFDGDWRKGTRSPIALPSAVPAPPVSAGPCDRACLEGHIDRYLAAMVAHDPRRLPVAAPVRFSENDVPLRLGDALWRTASAVGSYKLYFADPSNGQVGFFGTIREHGKPAALVLRLKLERGLITEAETLVLRNEAAATSLEKAGSPDPILLEPVPAGDRAPRATLIATANSYFEAIEQGNGAVAPFDAACNRFENGIRTSGAQGCSAQLDTHIFDYIQKIYPRRFMVVDEERQTVFGFFMFNHPGDILWVNVPGEGRREMPAAATRPFAVDVAELFKIKDRKIRKVEALMVSLPYGARSPFVPQQ